MTFFSLGVIFALGTIIGSFLNVVIYRLNTGFSIRSGRSRCFSCNKQLSWHELIPLVSFVLQKGRCRKCASAISIQYPLVEFATGTLFLLIAVSAYTDPVYNISLFLFLSFLVSLLIILFVYDLKHKILPSVILYPFVVIAFSYALWLYIEGSKPLLDVVAGIILALPVFLLWGVSRGRWIGFADGVLFLGVGSLLGFTVGLNAFIFSFWAGALVAIALTYAFPKRYRLQSEIPFGPFIIISSLFFLFSQQDILGVALFYELLK